MSGHGDATVNKVDKSPILSELTFWQRRWISTKLKMRREDPGRRRGRGGVAFSQGVGAAHTVTKAPKGPASVTEEHLRARPTAPTGRAPCQGLLLRLVRMLSWLLWGWLRGVSSSKASVTS